MQAYRLAHAGVILIDGDRSLVIDPGSFTTPEDLTLALESAPPVAGLVITHEHPDHWTPENVTVIRSIAPDSPIATTAATATALERAGIAGAEVVQEGDASAYGPFALEFYGGRHEVLHASIPVIDNVGVRVNERFAYGGDSLVRPPFAPDLLGVPIGSPWSNISQVMDFVLDTRAKRVYLTHDGMLSAAGLQLFGTRVRECLAETGGELVELPASGSAFDFGG